MNIELALELLKDIMPEDECWPVARLCDLLQHVYEQGWEEGISEYRENENPTDEQEWRL